MQRHELHKTAQLAQPIVQIEQIDVEKLFGEVVQIPEVEREYATNGKSGHEQHGHIPAYLLAYGIAQYGKDRAE